MDEGLVGGLRLAQVGLKTDDPPLVRCVSDKIQVWTSESANPKALLCNPLRFATPTVNSGPGL
jgi:hypothetical protein